MKCMKIYEKLITSNKSCKKVVANKLASSNKDSVILLFLLQNKQNYKKRQVPLSIVVKINKKFS